LEHKGSRSKISEQAIVRAHDRTLPLKLKMFASSNRAQKNIGATDTKEEAHDWDNPKVKQISKRRMRFEVWRKLITRHKRTRSRKGENRLYRHPVPLLL